MHLGAVRRLVEEVDGFRIEILAAVAPRQGVQALAYVERAPQVLLAQLRAGSQQPVPGEPAAEVARVAG